MPSFVPGILMKRFGRAAAACRSSIASSKKSASPVFPAAVFSRMAAS
jgi:hypothetical protein